MTHLVALERPQKGYGLKQIVRAELTKVATLRSTFWTLLITFGGTIAVTVLSTTSATHQSKAWYQGFDPTSSSLTGLALGVLAIGVLGMLSTTGEYGSGTIRSSLAAMPRRRGLLLGKILTTGGITLAVGEVLTFVSFGIGQAILKAGGAPWARLDQPGVLRAVVLSGAFVALLGLFALGLGVIIRHTAGSIAAYVGATFLVSLVLRTIPGDPTRFTPVGILANSLTSAVPQQGQVSPLFGFGLMVLYTAVILGLAALVFSRRDA